MRRDAGWKTWDRLFVTQAHAQDIGDVLNPLYTPTSPEARALFVEQQKFMLAVFADKLQTEKGKSLVQMYTVTADAQKIYAELQVYALKSTQAEDDAEQIHEYLLTSRANDSHWNGTMANYILDWLAKAQEYNDKSDVLLSDEQQRMYLQHAVSAIPELATVKTTAKTIAKTTGKKLDFTNYCELLSDAAQQYDINLGKNKVPRRSPRRHIYNTDVEASGAALDTFYDPEDHLEADDRHLEAYAQRQFSTHPRLPRNTWYALGSADQKAWDMLTDGGNAQICKHLRT